MAKILLCGANGRMGHMISELAQDQIVCGYDKFNTQKSFNYPVFDSLSSIPEDLLKEIDVLVDFSNVKSFLDVLAYAYDNKKALVSGTTGLSETDLEKAKEDSKEIPILISSNMSIGINSLVPTIVSLVQNLGPDFDIEIIEKHHNKKLDAPSGTALLFADAINNNDDYKYVFERESKRAERQKNEIGISSIRGGTIPGEHSIILAGNDEVIEIKHTAYSRKIFAQGAIKAADWIIDQKPGFYTYQDILKNE